MSNAKQEAPMLTLFCQMDVKVLATCRETQTCFYRNCIISLQCTVTATQKQANHLLYGNGSDCELL